MSPHPSCDIVFKDIDRIEDAIGKLNNSNFPLYNWYLRKTDAAHDLAAMNYEHAVRRFDHDNGHDINTLEIFGANSSQSLLLILPQIERESFQINLDDGVPCNLKEW